MPFTDAPLAGTRVVTLAVNVPGPVAAARLRRLGASVVKVQPPAGDPLGDYAAGWLAELDAGLEVRSLDLRSPDGRAELDELLASADVLLTASRGSALRRLGLGWEELHARCPQVVHVALVGHAAPDDDVAGHDLTYQATAGLLTPPQLPAVLAADLAGAERAVSEALAGLLLRARTGEGSRHEVAFADCATELSASVRHGLTAPGGLLGGGFAGYGLYRAQDGHVALAALEPHFWQRAQELLGGADHDTIAATLLTRTAAQWQRAAEEHDVPLVAVAGAPGSSGRGSR